MSAALWVCGPCQLASQSTPDTAEAAMLGREHDRIHHRGAPTAEIIVLPAQVTSPGPVTSR